ncbi:unnamed protein product [Ambrosiozyma monospora]|uniref:DNA polymerase delta subunit 3 n=1 Tax=Ambrosiozyma monospora TaxID=43982 RepID=A0A9W6T180_AMBMO|nr:unnamed protein product [Ambrosiozyma monospora]
MSELKAFDEITKYLFTDNLPITYKVLSRNLQISNTDAKDLLNRYYTKFHEEKQAISISYILTGIANGGTLVKLSKPETLDEDKKKFESLFNCVTYSLQPNPSINFNNTVAINLTLTGTDHPYTEKNCELWGVIRTETAKQDVNYKKPDADVVEEAKRPTPRPSTRKAASEPTKPTAKRTIKETGQIPIHIS